MQHQPAQLETLAVEVLVNYIINLCKKVDNYAAEIICANIKEIIHNWVSHVFANEITKKLLERICRLHHCYGYRITTELLQAFVHPKVTQLRLNFHDFYSTNKSDNGRHDHNEDIAIFLWNNIINRLTSLTKLYVSDKSNSYVPLRIPNHIVAIEVPHCDNLLTSIADSCPLLKELAVRDFKATPVSIQALQRLMALERLNIVNTACRMQCYGIDAAEFHLFITHLSTKLKYLSCSKVRVSDMSHLAALDLSSLSVFGLSTDASFSAQFAKLKEMYLWRVVTHPSQFLGAIGPQLTTLSLHLCVIENIAYFARQCPSLENLSLKRVYYFGPPNEPPNEHALAEFTSLKTVHLECIRFCCWCLLTNSVKLKLMTLCYYVTNEENSCLERFLRSNKCPDLEEFNAKNSLAHDVLLRLLNACPTIKIVKGIQRQSLIEEVKIIYPWVQFRC